MDRARLTCAHMRGVVFDSIKPSKLQADTLEEDTVEDKTEAGLVSHTPQ